MNTGMEKQMNNRVSIRAMALAALMLMGAVSPAAATSWLWPNASTQKNGKSGTILMTPAPAGQVYAPLPPATVLPPGAWGSEGMTIRDQQDQIKVIKKRTAAIKERAAAKQAASDRRKRIIADVAKKTAARPKPQHTAKARHTRRPVVAAPTTAAPKIARPRRVVAPAVPMTSAPIQPILPKAPVYQSPRVPAADWEKISPNPGTSGGQGIQPIIIPNRNLQKQAINPQGSPAPQPAPTPGTGQR